MPEQNDKMTLIKSDEFEKALVSAAEVKNERLELCKSRNKNNYAQFYDLVLATRQDIQMILDKKRKNRTDADVNVIKQFKKETSALYKMTCDFLVPEQLEEGEPSKVEKLVKKVAAIVRMLDYLGHNEIDNEFKKYGIELNYKKMDEEDAFSQSNVKSAVKSIFTNGVNIKDDINKGNEEIKTGIYESSVPVDLQFDKSTNPTGIKAADFCKLVDLKAKYLRAQDESAKGKVEEIATNMAEDYVFQNKRNDIINQKLIEMTDSSH